MLGEFCIWQQKTAHAYYDENTAGSNYITMSHQLLVEVRVMAQAKFAVLSGYSHGKRQKYVNLVRVISFLVNEGRQYSFLCVNRDS